MQGSHNGSKVWLANLKTLFQKLKNFVTLSHLKLAPWGSAKITFTPDQPNYLIVAHYKVHWCSVLQLKSVSIEVEVHRTAISEEKTTPEFLREAIMQIPHLKDWLALFEVAKNNLKLVRLCVHELNHHEVT